jgi:hypothetical protein
MNSKTFLHRQRIAILVIAALGLIACFIPLGRVPRFGTLHDLEIARHVVCGCFVVLVGLVLLGRWSQEMRLPVQISSLVVGCCIVGFAIFRIGVLGSRSMPVFADDDPSAGAYYQKACDLGVMEGCALLGGCYWTGTCGVVKDARHGFGLYEKACDGGDMGACGQLGVCYEVGGCGLLKSGEKAVRMYEKACTGGEVGMCNNLGVCYNKGQCGLGKNETRAAELYAMACKGGESSACHNLEVMRK